MRRPKRIRKVPAGMKKVMRLFKRYSKTRKVRLTVYTPNGMKYIISKDRLVRAKLPKKSARYARKHFHGKNYVKVTSGAGKRIKSRYLFV